MGLFTFFVLRGSILEKILKVLCLMCWGLGGCAYLYACYETVLATIMFPSGTTLITAHWVMHLALRFFVLWVPMGFLLNQWQMRSLVIPIVYLIGCIAAILFALISIILLIKEYAKDPKDVNLREEYVRLVLEETKKGFPKSVESNLDNYKCCGWYGPTDFAPKSLFDISRRIDDPKEAPFMEKVAKCYGNTFKVSLNKEKTEVIYKSGADDKAEPPQSCGELLVQTANRQVVLILALVIITSIFTLAIMILYIITFCKAARQVGPVVVPTTQSQMVQDQQPSVVNATDTEELKSGGPSDTPSVS